MAISDAELTREIKRRLRILRACADDPKMQANAVVTWRDDPVAFINDCVWTQDPRLLSQNLPAEIPLKLFAFQEDLILWLRDLYRDRESGVVEKSRDMGASWCVLGFYVWMWLFEPGCQLGLGSRKENLVDKKGDPDSLFERIRFILSRLPGWLRPEGFDRRVHDNFMLIRNPENGASIRGEAGDNIGRGGRSTMYVVDESAHLQRPALVDAALSNNSEVIVHVSSVNGRNHFHTKATSGAYRVMRLHWSLDPRKSPEWREAMLAKLGPVIVAQEVDIDYSASVEGVIIPDAWVRSAMALHRTHAEELDEYRDDPPTLGFDIADGGGDVSVIVPRCGPLVLDVHDREQGDTTLTARWGDKIARELGCHYLLFDPVGVGAGVAGELSSIDRERAGGLGYARRGVNVGLAVVDIRKPGVPPASERFANLKAQLWWNLRRRFELTHQYVTGTLEGEADIDDMIALPQHDRLVNELSSVTYSLDGRSKIKIESKRELKSRLGPNASPDYADALVLAFASDILRKPVRRESAFKHARPLQIHTKLDIGF